MERDPLAQPVHGRPYRLQHDSLPDVPERQPAVADGQHDEHHHRQLHSATGPQPAAAAAQCHGAVLRRSCPWRAARVQVRLRLEPRRRPRRNDTVRRPHRELGERHELGRKRDALRDAVQHRDDPERPGALHSGQLFDQAAHGDRRAALRALERLPAGSVEPGDPLDGDGDSRVSECSANAQPDGCGDLEYNRAATERCVRLDGRRADRPEGLGGALLLHHPDDRDAARRGQPECHVSGHVHLERRQSRFDLPAWRADRHTRHHRGNDDDVRSQHATACTPTSTRWAWTGISGRRSR